MLDGLVHVLLLRYTGPEHDAEPVVLGGVGRYEIVTVEPARGVWTRRARGTT